MPVGVIAIGRQFAANNPSDQGPRKKVDKQSDQLMSWQNIKQGASMGHNQPPRYRDFSNAQSEKNKFAQRQINEQDEDHIDDEFINRAPADYDQYQTESKPNENEFIQEGYLGDNNSEGDIAGSQLSATNLDDSDKILKEKISEILTKDREIDAKDIHVTVKGGTVLLNGTTQSRDEKIKVEMAIQDVKGVEDIKNNLKLRKLNQK